MTHDAARTLHVAIAFYLAIGAIVGVPFVISGIRRVDPAARGTPWTFRLLVLPGTIALWPLILRRWLSARSAP